MKTTLERMEADAVIDPLGRPTIKAGNDHYFHTCRPSVRPSIFENCANNFQMRMVIATGRNVCLTEGIIDKTCMFIIYLLNIMLY